MTKQNELPKPEEGIDFYTDKWHRYTVSIDVEFNELEGEKSDSERCDEAVGLFREGAIDGTATIVHSEKIKDIALDIKTDLPFDSIAWQISKCKKSGLRGDGSPLRPWEKAQPKTQTEIEMFLGCIEV